MLHYSENKLLQRSKTMIFFKILVSKSRKRDDKRENRNDHPNFIIIYYIFVFES